MYPLEGSPSVPATSPRPPGATDKQLPLFHFLFARTSRARLPWPACLSPRSQGQPEPWGQRREGSPEQGCPITTPSAATREASQLPPHWKNPGPWARLEFFYKDLWRKRWGLGEGG